MTLAGKIITGTLATIAVAIVATNIIGALTMGTLQPGDSEERDPTANTVVMVFGATGTVGDGLLKAAMADPEVREVHVVTRRTSPRIDAGVASGRVQMHLHEDFSDYDALRPVLQRVNTVLWGLGTSSIGMDPETYRVIHEDFPIAFVQTWLETRQAAPMSFHFVTGLGTGEDERAEWAQVKGRTERRLAELADGTGLRTFGYRCGYVRPTSEQAGPLDHLAYALFRPGGGSITAVDLGHSMLEISARRSGPPNGALVDNVDSLAFASAYPFQ